MGPPPRSLTAEANSCFMVRVPHGPNRIQGCGASIAPERGLPSDQLYRTSNKEGHRAAVTRENPIDAMILLLNRRGEVMQGFVQGADRQQTTLLPECLDDWVGESNSIRAVDVFVDALELRDLGCDGVDRAAPGRPAYHPSPMLKLYIYGYLNRVQSSRRLEREAGRNLEVMWLTGRLAPDHKTIAHFRKDNGAAIKKVCAQFVELCRKMGLLTKASVAIDGSKFKAVNSRDNNFTQGKIQRRQKQIEESVARYMSQLDTADRH